MRCLLLLAVLLVGMSLYINYTPTFTEDYDNYPDVKALSISSADVVPDDIIKDEFLLLWNGYYPYSKTVPGVKELSNFLEVIMKDQDHGIVIAGDDHWTVRSYGPTILSGDSYNKDTTIYLEMIGDMRHTKLPRLNIRITDNKTGKVSSLSSKTPGNLNAYSIKVV